MDTGRLKRFSIEARTILMQGVKHRLQALGFDLRSGVPSEVPQKMEGGAVFMNDVVSTDFYRRWMSLYNNVKARSIKEVAEEAAYTWFNRFMAIRIMAKQKFIAPVLAYESDQVRIPVIVGEARQGRMPKMTEAVRSQLMDLLEDDSLTNEQFALLIVAYCHENPIINKCFGAIADYTELLLPQNILAEGGFVDMINHTEFITDEQYASAELIGWLYQFYISDRKDEAFAKKGKYDADEIAPATQIFTPNWIVKYMVQNTIGRIYLDNNPYEDDLKSRWSYLVEPSEPTPKESIFHYEDLKELKSADLASGSGHILNEGFDIFYDLYINEGYSRRDAIENIFRYNLVGIDIDTRAKQLATFALLMKACQKDASFLDGHLMPRVYNMPRPIKEVIPADWEIRDEENADEEFLRSALPHFLMGSNREMVSELTDAILLMNDADTLGSIMKFDLSESTRNTVMVRVDEYEQQLASGDLVPEAIQALMPYMHIILALTDKYAAICMNPPYMGSGRFDNALSKYVKDNYADSKADLFSVFMEVAIDRLEKNGKYGMINMQSWMFLSSFENLRKKVLDDSHIDNMLHLGPRTFDELSGEVVQNTAFVITNEKPANGGTYFRLVDGKDCGDKERMFIGAQKFLNGFVNNPIGKNNFSSMENFVSEQSENQIRFDNVSQKDFEKIPGKICGYWVSKSIIDIFINNKSLSSFVTASVGIQTGNNDAFMHFWWELAFINIKTDATDVNSSFQEKKWFPFNKGGAYRKWAGNDECVVDWKNDGQDIKENSEKTGHHYQQYSDTLKFQPMITWSRISSIAPAFRYKGHGYLSDMSGFSLYPNRSIDFNYLLAICNSKVGKAFLDLLSPTINYMIGPVTSIPIIYKELLLKTTSNIVENCIKISRQDWDAHETSWDFQENELIKWSRGTSIEEDGERVLLNDNEESLQLSIDHYKGHWGGMFQELHDNEEELNSQFIEIYGLQDELTPNVPLEEITILQQGEISINDNNLVWHDDVIIKQLISYAVGCMMGRYSIDKSGLILANQGDGLKEYNKLVPRKSIRTR
jgi:hypothetical protein